MTSEKGMRVFLVWLLAMSLLISCSSPGGEEVSRSNVSEATQPQSPYAGKAILWVDSYHQGYEWSDGIEKGIRSMLEGTGIELRIFRMDTKQKPENCKQAGEQAWQQIQAIKPDVVIATDDNAQRCLVVPYLKGREIPVIFAGVNWSADEYGYPTSNVTGMVEVDLVEHLMAIVSPYAKGSRVGYVAIETETEHKIADTYNARFFDGQMKVYWAASQAEFQQAFLAAQSEADILFVSNNAGALDWNHEEMRQFLVANTRVPTVSVNPWMSPYVLATLAKVPEEQGQAATEMALKVLAGTPVASLSIVFNDKGRLIFNLTLADRLKIILLPSMLKNAEVVE